MISATISRALDKEAVGFRGLIFYDAQCGFCRNLARRFQNTFNRRGFRFVPFAPGARPSEMHVRTSDDRDFGGADAVIFLSSFIWWATPLFQLAKLPGARPFLDRLYRKIAARRSCQDESCQRLQNQ